MSYARDFTIGLRETQSFHLSIVLRRWWKGAAGIGVAAALVVWMYMPRLAPGSPTVVAGLTAAVFGAMTAVGILAGLALSTMRQVRNRMRGQEAYVQSTSIDGFGIHVTVGKKDAKLPFDRLFLVRETRKAFYLFIAEGQAWILPKAQMEDPVGECAELRRIFRAVVEKGKLQLKK